MKLLYAFIFFVSITCSLRANSLENDSLVLLKMGSTLGWDSTKSIYDWNGVRIVNGRVDSISVGGSYMGISPRIKELTELKVLRITAFSKYINLPAEVWECSKLEKLDIGLQGVLKSSVLPPGIEKLKSLKVLSIDAAVDSGIVFNKLPDGLWLLDSLVDLTLIGTFPLIPQNCAFQQTLSSLKISRCSLSNVPEHIYQFDNLQNLDLSDNKLTSLTMELTKLQNLVNLNIRSNRLVDFPEKLIQLNKLENLLADSCRLERLPNSFAEGASLRAISLNNNNFTSFPEGLCSAPNLQELTMIGNKLTTIPESIGNISTLEGLYLSNNEIQIIPSTIGLLTNLNALYLDGNQINVIPDEIGGLLNLENLELSSNFLHKVPEKLWQLIKLQDLNLSENLLSEIHVDLGNLVNLKKLNIASNTIESIPDEIGRLRNLKYFNTVDNKLTTLPDIEWDKLELADFYFSRNSISDLPVSVFDMRRFMNISIHSNNFHFDIVEKCIDHVWGQCWYNPMSSVPTFHSKDSSFLYVRVGGKSNSYQWYSCAKGETDYQSVSGATKDTLPLNPQYLIDTIFICKINNSIATDLTIESQDTISEELNVPGIVNYNLGQNNELDVWLHKKSLLISANAKDIDVAFHSVNGRLLLTKCIKKQGRYTTMRLPDNLSSGVYFITVKADDMNRVVKLIK